MIQRFTFALTIVIAMAHIADAQNRYHRRRGALLGGLAGAALGVAIGDKGNNETAGALIGGAAGAIAGGMIGDSKDRRIEHHSQYHGQSSYYQPHYPAPPRYAQPAYPPVHHDPWQAQPMQQSPSPYRGYQELPQVYPSYRQPHTFSTPPAEPYSAGYLPAPANSDGFASELPAIAEPIESAASPLSVDDILSMTAGGLSESMIIAQIRNRGFQQVLSVSDIISLHRRGISETVLQAMQGFAPEPSGSTEPDVQDSGVSILAPANP